MTPGCLYLHGGRVVRLLEIREDTALVRAEGSARTFRTWARYLTPWRPQ